MSITDKILEVLQSAVDWVHEGFLTRFLIYSRVIFTGISDFVLNLFSDFGNSIIGIGDTLANAFEKNGFASFNNFFSAFIGIIFFVFCIKVGIKLVLKIIEIIGNYIPLT